MDRREFIKILSIAPVIDINRKPLQMKGLLFTLSPFVSFDVLSAGMPRCNTFPSSPLSFRIQRIS